MVGEELRRTVIGDVGPEDLPLLLEIENASFTTPWSEISFFNELKRPGSIVRAARRDGIIVGYFCANRVLDEGHILDLAVHPEFRRLGIASLLISHAIELLKAAGCRFVFLEVRHSNEIARKMYEKFGFDVLGTRKNYYASPVEDAVIMVLRFGD